MIRDEKKKLVDQRRRIKKLAQKTCGSQQWPFYYSAAQNGDTSNSSQKHPLERKKEGKRKASTMSALRSFFSKFGTTQTTQQAQPPASYSSMKAPTVGISHTIANNTLMSAPSPSIALRSEPVQTVETASKTEISRYDHLKKTAEKLLKVQTESMTDVEVLVRFSHFHTKTLFLHSFFLFFFLTFVVCLWGRRDGGDDERNRRSRRRRV